MSILCCVIDVNTNEDKRIQINSFFDSLSFSGLFGQLPSLLLIKSRHLTYAL